MKHVRDEEYEKILAVLDGRPELTQFHTWGKVLLVVSLFLVLTKITFIASDYFLPESAHSGIIERQILLHAIADMGVILFFPALCMWTFSKDPMNSTHFFEEKFGLYSVIQIVWYLVLSAYIPYNVIYHSSIEQEPTSATMSGPPYFWLSVLAATIGLGCFVFLNDCIKQMKLYEENKK